MTRGSDPRMQAIAFRAIERAADAGERCPSNITLARLMGVRSTGTAADVVSKLEESGRIVVERTGSSRRVTIVATGRSTFHEKRASMPAPPARISRQPTMPRKRPDLRIASTAPQSRVEQIRAECAAEAAARLDRRWSVSTTSTTTFSSRAARLEAEEVQTEVRGRPCFMCGAAGGCTHTTAEDARYG